MTKTFGILFGLLLASQAVGAQAPYILEIDAHKSALFGAENLLTFHRALYAAESRYLKARWSGEQTPAQKTVGVIYRLGKTILIDNPVDFLTMLIQHEVFGHGARYREFGYTDNAYHINLHYPFGGSGHALASTKSPLRKETEYENLAMASGGSEANTLLSEALRSRWLQRGSLNTPEAILYLFSANDLNAYILRTKTSQHYHGTDIVGYLAGLNRLEGYPAKSDFRLTVDDLFKQMWINALNPFQYISLYAYFVSYLWKGEEMQALPMLHIRNTGYLPAFRLGLTPFGSEVYFENFLVGSRKIADIYCRRGFSTFHTFYGLGVHIDNLVEHRNFSCNANIDLWHQPALQLGGTTVHTGHAGTGGAFSSRLFYTLKKTSPQIRFTTRLEYKTTGFLEGEPLDKGITGSFGLCFVEI